MASTRQLVTRRKAIRNIRKITRTMELIATARFKKAMDRATQAAAYTTKIAELAANLSATATDVSHPLLEKRETVKNGLLLVLSSNRGLCGGYNTAILREASARVHDWRSAGIGLTLELSGKRAITYFKYQQMTAAKTFTQFEEKPTYEEVEPLADRYLEMYIKGTIDRVDVAYTSFISAARQVAVIETLLPLSAFGGAAKETTPVEYEFLPGPKEILEQLLPESFKVRLFKCFLDAAVSEQIARRVTMKLATENADEMIKNISQHYNRARQAQITKEISEVIGGAAALE
jgi:F-type H+-transporting ATPase subunit gamma